MTEIITTIADRVRGVAAEKRFSQQRLADTLKLSRTTVVERINGRVPFTAAELFTLAQAMNVPVTRFFPTREEALAQLEQTSQPESSVPLIAGAKKNALTS